MKRTLVALLVCPAIWAGEFVNLTFDEPDLTNVRPFKPPGNQYLHQYAPVEEVFQGWTINEGFLISLNMSRYQGLANVDGGESTLSLSPWGALGAPPYAVKVKATLDGWERPPLTLTQVGVIPDNAGTLRWWNAPDLWVYVNGKALLGQRVDMPGLLYEANVSAYAGEEVELYLKCAAGSAYTFDVLGFVPIPEPTPSTLLIVGGLFMVFCRRRAEGL